VTASITVLAEWKATHGAKRVEHRFTYPVFVVPWALPWMMWAAWLEACK
jgi:hypothetical protein